MSSKKFNSYEMNIVQCYCSILTFPGQKLSLGLTKDCREENGPNNLFEKSFPILRIMVETSFK